VEVNKPIIAKMIPKGNAISALITSENVDFDEQGIQMSDFYDREHLEPNMIINGPAIIVESSTSTVVPPNHQFRIDEYANIIISKKQ
jgi:N-methylhydantoinase A